MTIYLLLTFSILVAVFVALKIFSGKFGQLSYQNRLLRALRRLDIAALSTKELETLCQEIVDAMHLELGFAVAVIALVDYKNQVIRRIAISYDQKTAKAFNELIPVQVKEQVVPLYESRNLFSRVVNERKNFYTTNLQDTQFGVLPPEISLKIQQLFNMNGIFVYPLVSRDKVIGVLEYTSEKLKEKLSKYEFTIMEEFTAEASRSLENVLLYQDLKQTSEELKIANVKLQQMDKLKDDFVSIASHELRTPMTAIRSYVWMALNRPDITLSEKMKKYLSRTLISTERLINLVNDMLNVSRIEAGRIEINPQAFNIVNLAKEVMDEVKPKADEKKLNLMVLESQMPQAFGDPDKLHQVLLNLVGNSLKFTPENGSITISFFTDGHVLETSVKDTGVGISKEDQSRLFRKFERLDSSYVATSSSGGTGLGLYISKSLIYLMHGEMKATSEGVGKGTIFTFSLPVASQEIQAQSEKYHVKPSDGESKGLEPVAI